jgi:hypothetical protein
MEQGINRFKDLIDTRKGVTHELKKSCAKACNISYRRVLRMYNGEQEVLLSPEQIGCLIAWGNDNKVPGSPDVTLSYLIAKTEVIPVS